MRQGGASLRSGGAGRLTMHRSRAACRSAARRASRPRSMIVGDNALRALDASEPRIVYLDGLDASKPLVLRLDGVRGVRRLQPPLTPEEHLRAAHRRRIGAAVLFGISAIATVSSPRSCTSPRLAHRSLRACSSGRPGSTNDPRTLRLSRGALHRPERLFLSASVSRLARRLFTGGVESCCERWACASCKRSRSGNIRRKFAQGEALAGCTRWPYPGEQGVPCRD